MQKTVFTTFFLWMVVAVGPLFAQYLTFKLDDQGYVRNWYNTGLQTERYTGIFPADNRQLQRVKEELYTNTPLEFSIPSIESFDSQLTSDIILVPKLMGENIFVENAKFHYVPTLIRSYSLTGLKVDKQSDLQVTLMTEAGGLDLWCNGYLIAKKRSAKVGRYTMYDAVLPLEKGVNTIFIRQIDLAVRDHRCNFALRVDSPADGVQVVLPGNEQFPGRIFGVEKWLNSVVMYSSGEFRAVDRPTFPVEIT